MAEVIGAIIATIAAMVLGAAWYSPDIFGKTWSKLSKAESDVPSLKYNLISAFGFFVMFLVVSMFMEMTGMTSIVGAIQISSLIWLGFIATTLLGSVTWEKKPWTLYLLNTSYQLLAILTGSIIISIFY